MPGSGHGRSLHAVWCFPLDPAASGWRCVMISPARRLARDAGDGPGRKRGAHDSQAWTKIQMQCLLPDFQDSLCPEIASFARPSAPGHQKENAEIEIGGSRPIAIALHSRIAVTQSGGQERAKGGWFSVSGPWVAHRMDVAVLDSCACGHCPVFPVLFNATARSRPWRHAGADPEAALCQGRNHPRRI